MSKGLGKMQWRILALMQRDGPSSGIIQVDGQKIDLDEISAEIFDLREIQDQMSHEHGARDRHVWMTSSFQSSFSRAYRVTYSTRRT
jgi:hypothetical protein